MVLCGRILDEDQGGGELQILNNSHDVEALHYGGDLHISRWQLVADVEDKTALSVNRGLVFSSNLVAGRLRLILFVILLLIIFFILFLILLRFLFRSLFLILFFFLFLILVLILLPPFSSYLLLKSIKDELQQ